MRIFLFLLLYSMHAVGFTQNRYDVVIDEIMADPVPQAGLPTTEWVELKNTSSNSFNLQNWRIGDASGQSGPMPNFNLQPDSLVIICPGSAVSALSVFGPVISVTSFPSLDNDGDLLFLKSANGNMIHAIEYSPTWYKNELKKEGGWSLEMIDPGNPCSASANWNASLHVMGGTPGKKNSIDAINPDQTGPRLKNAYAVNDTTLILVFDEPVDSIKGATAVNYSIEGITITGAITLAPLFNRVQLTITPGLAVDIIYTIVVRNQLTDCSNNPIGGFNTARVGLPSDPSPGEWVINEILFNPRPNGFDYVEFYNNSENIFDASKLYIATRNSSGAINSIKALANFPYYIFPGDHIVVTEDADNLALNYLVKYPENVFIVSPLPSYPDDEGLVLGLNYQGVVVDEVRYKDDWHFRLIDNDEGVALERIDPSASPEASNWHSSASTAGYGTPGYRNSQYRHSKEPLVSIDVDPKIFSPDNDGRDDIASVQYQMPQPGSVANVIIFDAAGRPVRNLVKNDLLGLKGHWNWDGLDEKGRKLPVGVYIIYIELFNLQGKKNRFKNSIVLARALK